MGKIKVLVVDDSAFMRKILTDILSETSSIEVVGTAKNGEEALVMIKKLSPDLVTLDVEMPVMDGITALKHIVKEYSIPVVMLSSLTQSGADLTLQALEIGAVDFITKPTSIFKINTDEIKTELIDKILEAAQVKISRVSKVPIKKVPDPKPYRGHLLLKNCCHWYFHRGTKSTSGSCSLNSCRYRSGSFNRSAYASRLY